MFRAGADGIPFQGSTSFPNAITDSGSSTGFGSAHGSRVSISGDRNEQGGRRRTPRKCLIVALAENHVVSSDQVAARLAREGGNESVDVILACAGQATSISALQRRIRDLKILLAPVGTSTEDLRELAMKQASGDIVALLNGTPAPRDNG